MSRTLTLSDELFSRLEATAKQRGLSGVEQLLETWQASEEERVARVRAVQRIDDIRAHLSAKYGEMPDSAALLREDRER